MQFLTQLDWSKCMQDYNSLIKRYEELKNKIRDEHTRKYITRKETQKLLEDMCLFMKEDHPEEEKVKFFPFGMIESLGMLLDDSNPEKSFRFCDDK